MIRLHESPLPPINKAVYLLVNPRFIVGDAANLFGWDNVLTEVDVVCDAMREPLSAIPVVLLEQFQMCDMETPLEGLICFLRPNFHSPCAVHLLILQ